MKIVKFYPRKKATLRVKTGKKPETNRFENTLSAWWYGKLKEAGHTPDDYIVFTAKDPKGVMWNVSITYGVVIVALETDSEIIVMKR